MARFDVYQFNARVPYVIEVQADILSHLGSVVVIPLVLQDSLTGPVMTKLNPVFHVLGRNFVLMTTDIATVPRVSLGPWAASMANQHRDIVDAIDFLLQGF